MTMAAVCGFILCLFIGLLALTILYLIWTNKINLQHLLSEADGSASMSRFQLLIFTFVIAISFFEIVESGMKLPDIPTGVLTLLGISASTYAVGKGISYSQPEVMMQTGPNADAADAAEASADEAKVHAEDAKAHADSAQQSAVDAKNANP
jgi:hypothetical protein